MMLNRVALAVVLLGNRLVAATRRGRRVETLIVEAEQPSAALRAELEARKLRVRAAAVGLARGSVAVKPIDLPEVAGELREMVRFELERHLPFVAEDAAFDFVPLPREPGATAARRVLVTAAERRVVDAAFRLVQEANLRPSSVTVAAHDLLALVGPDRKLRVAWVHRVGSDVEVLFCVGSALVLSRSLAGADDAVLAEEIKRSFSVLKWRTCDAIWVSGDATAPGGPTLSPLAGLGVPVTDPPYTAAARRLLGDLPAESRGARQLAVAVVAPSPRRARPLDLLPPAMKPRRLTRAQVLTVANAAAAIVLSIAALLAPGYRDRQRLANVNAEIARLDPEVKSIERLLQELERKQKLLGMVDSIETGAIRPLPVLRDLTELLPNDAWLTLLSLDAKGVELTGQAASASSLIPLLENSPLLERVEFASPVTRGRDREQFRIVAKWEAPAARVTSGPPPPAPTVAAPGASRPARSGTVRSPGAPAESELGGIEPRRPPSLPPTVERRR